MGGLLKSEVLLSKIEQAWVSLAESYRGLAAEQMLEPGVSGEWSVKDILAHITWWEEEALKYLPMILQGRRPPRYSALYGGIDAFNAQMADQKRGLALSEVLFQLHDTHQRLIHYILSVPEDQYAPRRASVTGCAWTPTAIIRSTPGQSASGGSKKVVLNNSGSPKGLGHAIWAFSRPGIPRPAGGRRGSIM